MKKVAAVLLAVTLVLGTASAQMLSLAAQPTSSQRLECYTGYSEEGGLWQAHGVLADAALYYMEQRAAEFAYQGACLFYLELSGSDSLGLIVPRLEMYYVSNTPLAATAVSLAFGGNRYDLDVTCEQTTVGGRRAERMTAYLDADGLQMLRLLQEADEVRVRIHGEEQVYTTTITREPGTQTKRRLESASLDASRDMLSELDAMGAGSYGLWELSRGAYRQQYGEFLDMQAAACDAQAEGFRLDAFGQLTRGDTGESVRALQMLLLERGFLLGETDSSYGEMTAVAVRRAQTYYGLMPTGSCDGALIALLQAGDAAFAPEEEQAAPRESAACEVTLERFYVASAVSASAQPLTVARAVTNADNVLVVVEGRVENYSTQEVNLYWQMTGTLRIGEYAYKVEALCESNQGESLESALLPLAGGRFLAVAEIPQAACAQPGEWTLELQMGAESWEYALER